MDYYGNGKINYSEFLAATLSANDTITDEMLWQVFKTFDVDNTDFISQPNLIEAFKRLGRDYFVGEKQVKELIEIHDVAHDGKISFEEFKGMFSDQKKPDVAEYDFKDDDDSVIEIKDARHLGRYKKRAYVVVQPSLPQVSMEPDSIENSLTLTMSQLGHSVKEIIQIEEQIDDTELGEEAKELLRQALQFKPS